MSRLIIIRFLSQTFARFRLGSNCTALVVQHYCFLPRPICSCLTRLKLTICCTNIVVQFSPNIARTDLTDSSVLMQDLYVNFKAMRYEARTFYRIVADK